MPFQKNRRLSGKFGSSAKTNRDLASCPSSKEELPHVASSRWQPLIISMIGFISMVHEPLTGDGLFLELPRLTGECFQIFIDELSATFADTLNVIVLDNGRFHHAKSLVIADNVVLIFLPPYSPELNPIERLWQDIKQKLFARTYQTLEQMQQQLSQILGKYPKAAIAKITSFPYLLNTANAI